MVHVSQGHVMIWPKLDLPPLGYVPRNLSQTHSFSVLGYRWIIEPHIKKNRFSPNKFTIWMPSKVVDNYIENFLCLACLIFP